MTADSSSSVSASGWCAVLGLFWTLLRIFRRWEPSIINAVPRAAAVGVMPHSFFIKSSVNTTCWFRDCNTHHSGEQSIARISWVQTAAAYRLGSTTSHGSAATLGGTTSASYEAMNDFNVMIGRYHLLWVTVRAKMHLHSIITYLSMKNLNAREIYTDMNDILGEDCINYSSVTKNISAKKVSRSRYLT
jgi:hypothetical protein